MLVKTLPGVQSGKNSTKGVVERLINTARGEHKCGSALTGLKCL